jgi:hypothetical protein
MIWDALFKNTNWLNDERIDPVLVGCNLKGCYDNPHGQAIYVALATRDNTGDVRYRTKQFRGSLRKHTFYEERLEVVFPSGIVLNVHDVFQKSRSNCRRTEQSFFPKVERDWRRNISGTETRNASLGQQGQPTFRDPTLQPAGRGITVMERDQQSLTLNIRNSCVR